MTFLVMVITNEKTNEKTIRLTNAIKNIKTLAKVIVTGNKW